MNNRASQHATKNKTFSNKKKKFFFRFNENKIKYELLAAGVEK